MTRNGSRDGVEVVVELTETRADGGRRNGGQEVAGYRKADVMQVCIRFVCMLTSLTGMLVMLTPKLQSSTISLYHSQRFFFDTFGFVVVMCGVVAIHSFFQMVIKLRGMLSKPPIIPSRKYGWILFAADQINAVAMTYECRINCIRLGPSGFLQALAFFL